MVWKRVPPLDKSGIGPQGRIAIRGPSVLTVLAVLPGFSKRGLSWRDSVGVLRPLRARLDGESVRPHYLGRSDALVVLGSGAQEASVNIWIVETGI